MKTTTLGLVVLTCCLTMAGCAGSNARYEEAVAKGEVPFCAQSQNYSDPACTVMRGH
jgi:hypothetical protein